MEVVNRHRNIGILKSQTFNSQNVREQVEYQSVRTFSVFRNQGFGVTEKLEKDGKNHF